MITREDLETIIQHFDDRYVLQSHCSTKQEQINSKLANDDKRIDLILQEQKQMRTETRNGLKFNNWLTTAVLGAMVAEVIAFYFFIA